MGLRKKRAFDRFFSGVRRGSVKLILECVKVKTNNILVLRCELFLVVRRRTCGMMPLNYHMQ